VLEACAARVTLAAAGPVESLNVSAAAAVLFHSLGGAPPPRPRPRR
jgi:TrmH RNA methyltransferase